MGSGGGATGVPDGFNPQANTKCPHKHGDRIFREPAHGSSGITQAECFAQCQSTAGCNHFSWGQHGGANVCMGCTTLENAQTHNGFTAYDMRTHYLTVVSWPAHAWNNWNNSARGGPIEKCMHKDATNDTDGSGFLFTSCCTIDGEGMSRDCRAAATRNAHFADASAQCVSQGGRLCTAEEAMGGVTASTGCSVDGPRRRTGADMNRLWTSTPCEPTV